MSVFTRAYWKAAAVRLKSPKILAVSALLVAVTIAITTLYIPLPNNLHVFFAIAFIVKSLRDKSSIKEHPILSTRGK